jgi:hypothetical protein
MVATTFDVNFDGTLGTWANKKKMKLILGISLFLPTYTVGHKIWDTCFFLFFSGVICSPTED